MRKYKLTGSNYNYLMVLNYNCTYEISLFIVSPSKIIEITPTALVLLSVLQFRIGETLHGTNVLLYLFLFEIWDSNFSKINSQKPFDLVPIFDITLSLGNSF
jgi:hypothetical protein